MLLTITISLYVAVSDGRGWDSCCNKEVVTLRGAEIVNDVLLCVCVCALPFSVFLGQWH